MVRYPKGFSWVRIENMIRNTVDIWVPQRQRVAPVERIQGPCRSHAQLLSAWVGNVEKVKKLMRYFHMAVPDREL